ncbi:DUF2079 domain-containing protein [Nesterenkonia sphaerica]|uniref:DUF2079 domain-containing protein n=1 Tax=Nesterenkonia sphaerica TaxID=1804988 RepID=A0A5R9A385_9MICC|nr:DUF2079 domain-containing protein [Nesterenkonia sphaerica]TLP73159.1 DUF2079 domain-containing protein [Nesterenkonia sphaerica]
MTRPAVREMLALFAVMAGFAALYLAHSLLRFRNFEARGYDLGIFDQAVRRYAEFEAPLVPIKGENFHLLGDHFHPIIAVLAPLYWLWGDPRVLNIALVVLLVSAAVPIFLLVRGWFSFRIGILAAAALLAWWPFQVFIDWDFHEIAFAVPILGWVIWAVERRRPWIAVVLSAVLLLVREDMGATCIAIAAVLLMRRHWLPAAVLGAAGLTGLWVAVGLVIPHFAADGEFSYWHYSALGPSAGAAAVFLLTQPWNALPVLVDHPLKIALLTAHLLPLWLLPLASPYTLIALPMLLSRLLNDRLTVWGLVYHYDAPIAVIFVLAAFDTLRRIRNRLRPRRDSFRPAAVLPMSLIALSLVGGAVMQVATEREHHIFPLHWTYTGQNWQFPDRAQAHQRAVDLIPDGACVEAADTAAPHLTGRAYVGLAGTLDDQRVNWLIIDSWADELGGSDPLTPEEAFARAERLGFDTVTADDYGLWVLHRGVPPDRTCVEYVD